MQRLRFPMTHTAIRDLRRVYEQFQRDQDIAPVIGYVLSNGCCGGRRRGIRIRRPHASHAGRPAPSLLRLYLELMRESCPEQTLPQTIRTVFVRLMALFAREVCGTKGCGRRSESVQRTALAVSPSPSRRRPMPCSFSYR